jgi:hypothetical protein
LVRVGQLSNSNSGKFLSYTNTITYLPPEKARVLGLGEQGTVDPSLQIPGAENNENGNDTAGDGTDETAGDEAAGNGAADNTDNEVKS